mgnify:FL=1
MRIYDIIAHKRDGLELSDEEIAFFVKGYTAGKIKDYQAAALLMAIYLRGMTDRETVTLTNEMAHSGDMLDLSDCGGITVDKHSTGGVGDKTTLVVAPVVASLGAKVAKMSGRGLGHTGGTVDKLESINGFRTELTPEEFKNQVKDIGICVIGQSGNLAPADKLIYSLRDSTATVGSIPLIASSIMSKKLAAGAHCIVLDVKTGSGAFMKTVEEAEELSKKMVDIGDACGRKVAALITDMNTPLGKNIGNALEVKEAIEVLNGNGPKDLREVCVALASNIISLSENLPLEEAEKEVRRVLSDGTALLKLCEMVKMQGGSVAQIADPELLPKARFSHDVLSPADGFISFMDAEKIGSSSVILGAGRVNKGDPIDCTAGIILEKKTGEAVKKGELLATLFSNDEAKFEDSEKLFLSAFRFSDEKPQPVPLIYKTVR